MMNHRFQGNNPNLALRRPVRARAQATPSLLRMGRRAFDFEWLVLVLLFSARACLAAGIDHVVDYDNSGIWKRSNQQTLLYTLGGGENVGAVWEGGESGQCKKVSHAICSAPLDAL